MPSTPSQSQAHRKPISKRVRYEILRRDNHTCRYCRSTENPLTIDHVIPVALGGTDDPSNLVACCRDCNAGKTSSTPDAALVAQVSEDALRWAAAMKLAVERQTWDRLTLDNQLAPFVTFWTKRATEHERYDAPTDWRERLSAILKAGLPMETLIESAEVAFRSKTAENVFFYMLGVANNKLADLNERASKLIADGAV